MKLTEVKQFREITYRKKIKEAFPNASEQIINEAVDAAMNEIDLKKGLQTGLNVANKLANKVGKAAVGAGKKLAPVAKNLANKTKKAVVDPTLKGIKSVGKDIKKGYDNVKGLGADAVKTAKTGMAAMQKDMGGASTGAEPQVQQPQQKDVDQQLRKGTNRLKSITGLKSPAIAAQALQRAAAGEVLKPNERKEVAPILKALAQAMNSGTGVQRIISLIQQTKAK
jgi:hypothetical protein